MIIEMMGFPPADEQEILQDFKDIEALKKLGKNAHQRFDKKFENCPPVAVDLLKKMLSFDPKKRITVD
jgi:serine/threonine protein kinase